MTLASSISSPIIRPIAKNLLVPEYSNGVPSPALVEQAFASGAPSLSGLITGNQPGKGTQRTKQPGRYYNFDGTNDYIESLLTVPEAPMTVSFWFYADTLVSDDNIFTLYDKTNSRWNFVFNLDNGSGDYQILRRDASSSVSDDGNFTFATGQWYHVVCVIENTTDTKVYINGILDFESTLTATDVSEATAVRIGSLGGTTNPLDGRMADVRLYEEALTLSEVRELTTLGTDALPNKSTLLHYKCDDTHPTIAYDSSGNGNHGTKADITANTFHAEGSDAPFSFENDKGYTPSAYFDGTDDHVDSGVSIDLEDNAVTVTCKLVLESQSAQIIAAQGGSTAGWTFGLNGSGNLRWFTKQDASSSTHYDARGGTALELNTEYEVTSTLDMSSGSPVLTITIDGVDETITVDTAATGTYGDVGHTMTVGQRGSAGAGSLFFNGYLQDIVITDGTNTYTASGESPDVSGFGVGSTVSGPIQSYIPRDESDKTKDVFGGTLAYSGECPSNAQLIDGNCAHMDGSDDYVEVADHADFDITDNLSGFIRCTNDNATLPAIRAALAKYDSGANKREWLLGVDGDEKAALYLGTSGGASLAIWVSDDAIDPSAISSLGFTFDGGVPQLYVDGLPVAGSVASGTIPTTLNNEDAAVTIGAQLNSSAGFSFWDGVLYDARIFSGDSAPLTAAQMLQLHNNEAESFSGQTNVLWLPMAEGGGDKHYDASGNGHDGDINGHTVNNYFGSTQPNFHYNAEKGFSKRQNKCPYSAATSGFTNNNITVTNVADPFGGTNAIRLIPDDTSAQTYRIFTTCTNSEDGDYLVLYMKQHNSAFTHVGFRFTGGSAGEVSIADGATGNWSSGITVVSNYTVGDWRRVAVRFDSESAGVLQIGPTDNSNSIDATWTPPNDTDGVDVFFAVTDDPETEPLPTTGAITDEDAARNVPALADLSGDAVVSGHIQHAAGLNRADYKVDWTGGVAYPTKNHAVRDNIFTDTEDFSSSSWTHYSQVVTPGAVEAPNGTFTGTRVGTLHQTDPDLGLKQAESTLVTGGNTYTFSVYVKGEGDEVGKSIRIYGKRSSSGTFVSESLDYVLTDSWERVEASITLNSDNSDVVWSISGSAESGTKASECLVWGAKCEEWHEATPYIDSDRSSENIPTAWELPVERFSNVLFGGAVAGTPGTAPTGWTFTQSGGTLAVSDEELTFTVSTNRHFIYQGVSVVAGQIFEFEATITVESGTVAIQDVMNIYSVAGNFTRFVDGVGAEAADTITGTVTVKLRYEATASGNATPSIGAGVAGNRTQSVTIANPTFKRYYPNPLFHRELTKNGILHRADRLLHHAQILTGQRLTAAQNYTNSTAIS